MRIILLPVLILSFFFSVNANGTLIDRGNGLIYSTILDMTWIQDPTVYGEMTWDQAQSWANDLSYAGYTDWRLPTAFVADGQYEKNSEFGILYHDELGNDWRLSWYGQAYDPGPFTLSYAYWGAHSSSDVYYNGFFLDDGTSFAIPKQFINFSSSGVWAVRNGDVASVPEPSTLILLGTSAVIILGAKCRNRVAVVKS
ncbi:PEP-CTERM sorting domain-containing protein [Desulfobulbus rhabdoformis]|uniref:PEP-CTERM sorting domain-containing protein n=1 Tax=Desulfobulbus rhabdoformis TaxID=34032 RepID=UPI0019644B29|nr:PEP-CTERM sorting domain-containing protein [Desulfobulbus rhabdoformis]MBM9615289.1 PEP-CTERM sorting domain-containing protein [Desulfobulbus rhabdoformis]